MTVSANSKKQQGLFNKPFNKPAAESREDKFVRIVERRMDKLLKQFELLRNCSDKGVYTYSEAQVNKILKKLDEELQLTKLKFQNHKEKVGGFKL